MTFVVHQDGPSDIGPGAPSPSVFSTPAAVPGSRRGLLRRWVEGWWAVAMVGLGVFTGVLTLVVFVVAVAGLFSLPAALSGLLLLAPAVWAAWLLGRLQRRMLLVFTGVDVGPPPPSTAAPWRRVLGLDQPRLQAIAWAGLHGIWGLLTGALLITLLSVAIVLTAAPFLSPLAPDPGLRLLGLVRVDGPLGYAVSGLVGLVTLLVLPFLAAGLAHVDVALGRWLLGVDPQLQLREMSRRMETLTTSREETVDSVEAERRRIERDLHDGPQQRLVSIAMTLGLARTMLDTDPQGASALLDEAHASSKEAIVEMRQVARGIVPPILTDRGLDAAVSALAARSPVAVAVRNELPARLDPSVEAIAYFCVSEALTNVAKHAGATRADVALRLQPTPAGDRVAITVTDDGRGGAVVGNGTGLTGLRQRVASVDGELTVHSPPGQGTTVAISLPTRPRRTR